MKNLFLKIKFDYLRIFDYLRVDGNPSIQECKWVIKQVEKHQLILSKRILKAIELKAMGYPIQLISEGLECTKEHAYQLIVKGVTQVRERVLK